MISTVIAIISRPGLLTFSGIPSPHRECSDSRAPMPLLTGEPSVISLDLYLASN